MLTLQGKFDYKGDLADAPVPDVDLEFTLPIYKYLVIENPDDDNKVARRKIISKEGVVMTKGLESTDYLLPLPADFIIGKEEDAIDTFVKYITLSNKNLDNFSTKIDIQYFIENEVQIGIHTLEGFYFFRHFDAQNKRSSRSSSLAASVEYSQTAMFRNYLNTNIFLINKIAYLNLLEKLSSPSGDDFYLLEIISLMVEISDDGPILLKEISEETNKDIVAKLEKQSFEDPTAIVAVIKKYFNGLFDFPVLIPAIETIDVAGTFAIKTSDKSKISKKDLLYYDLSVEYSASNTGTSNSLRTLHYDWSKIDELRENTAPFSFTDKNPIIRNGITGLMTVKVKGFDGSVLYSKQFKPEDPTLGKLKIEVPLIKPIVLTPTDQNAPMDKSKKLRGQVIELSKKCLVKDLTVVIEAKKDGDELWRIVGAASTDSSGNFSLPYPYGTYIDAQAIVSLTPNNPAIIPINPDDENNETISDDFLYLLVKDVDCDCTAKEEDCDCDSPKKIARLPDFADLLESDEYSQDIGGSCVNLSTPNRTLSEYNYKAVVRTSDPDVANYILKKIENEAERAQANKAVQVAQSAQAARALEASQAAQTAQAAQAAYDAQVVRVTQATKAVNDNPYNPFDPASAERLERAQAELRAAQAALTPAAQAAQAAHTQAAQAQAALAEATKATESALDALSRAASLGASYELVGGKEKKVRKPIDLNNPVAWQDAPDDQNNLSIYQAVTVATGHILHYKSLFKADGYSLGDLLYSLALAPGQKKEIVIFDSSHILQAAESQSISQGERLAAGIIDDREITNLLGGSINESLRGSSSANTSGISAGLGVGAIVGPVGAVLGVAGGVANSNSSASQDSSRNISQFFGEKLRQSIMQNAEGYRQLNASVVTTVQEGQRYTATTEVVANHNHCHALTMMYFEVLRHYAIYQKLSSVEECVFVPLLLTNFTTQNIFKWSDVLATHLLPIPANTYLQPFSFIGLGRQHPLLKAFDANDRIKTNYANVDFPLGSFDDEQINFVKGEINLRVNLQRPKTRYDRILSLPIITNTTTSTTGDGVGGAVAGGVAGSIIGSVIGNAIIPGVGALIGGIAGGAIGGAIGADIATDTTTTVALVKKQVFDSFMQLDANYQTVPPAQCIRVTNFQPINFTMGGITISISGADFFENGLIDKQVWTAYATILGYNNVFDMLDYYFRNRLIAEWDEIYYNDIVPIIFDKIVGSINIDFIATDMTGTTRYKGGERLMQINLNGTTNKKRNQFPLKIKMFSSSANIRSLKDLVTLNIENVKIFYSTSHYNGILFSGFVGDDLLDGTDLFIPENSDEKRNPRKEDVYLVHKLIEHLNSFLEHYNKVLWYNLDQDRRYMLLDGFNIQIFNDFNLPVGFRSLASVIKNELITVVGNSLVFPVAAGYKVSESYIIENTDDGTENVTLFDHYKPLTPIEPFRISIPSKGVFAEAVQGACNACEKIETDRLQDWNRFPNTDEPTAILPINTPTPLITDWRAAYKDFATPMINIQTAPSAPTPGAGLAGISELLGKSGVFQDVTGLDANQQNVIRTYLSNQENAKAFAEMAKGMAMQAHNTQNSPKIMDTLKEAKNSGAISQEDYSKLVKEHLQQQIDGGESQKAELEKQKPVKPTLTDAAVKAVDQGKDVKAQKIDNEGNLESVEISGDSSERILATVDGMVPALQQENSMACWATAATMMMSWKKGQSLSVTEVLSEAGAVYLTKFKNGEGLASSEKEGFLSTLNMIGEAPANYSVQQYVDWLNTYGPLWITTDSSDADGQFSPHARILTKIVKTGTPDGISTDFIFNDPAKGMEISEPFTKFAKAFEQMVTDNKSGNLFVQVVHFKDIVSVSEGAGAGALTEEQKIAKLKADNKLDFESKKKYLEYLTNKTFSDALQAVFNLSEEVTGATKTGFETIEDLLDRDILTADQKAAIKVLDDKGASRRLKVIYDENLPDDLTDVEKVETATFFADQMEINRVNIQKAFDLTKLDDHLTLSSFGNNGEAKENAKNIIHACIKFDFRNKKHISYCLATANGEAKFLPVMEYSMSHVFEYNEAAAKYYYWTGGNPSKQSYNTGSIATGQTQLSDYLISQLTTLKFIKVTDLAKRTFTKGENIDDGNFAKLNTLLITTLSKKDAADKWTDLTKNESKTKELFVEMAGILNAAVPAQKIITDEILKMADFYRYAGKGLIQTTGKAGYANTVSVIQKDFPGFVDVEKEPEKLLLAENAIYALVIGLKRGAYGTKKKLEDYLKDGTASTDADWKAARYCVNGQNFADMFGQCAKIYADLVFRLRS